MGHGIFSLTWLIASLLSFSFGSGIYMGGNYPMFGFSLLVGGIAGAIGVVIGLLESGSMGRGFVTLTWEFASVLSFGFGAGVYMGGNHFMLGASLFVCGGAGMAGLLIGFLDS